MTASKQNYINHIALVLDASYSMWDLADKVVKVTDDLVAFLAKKSKDDNEETRITVYSFSDEVECHIWDMDVFRLPSMKGLYKIKNRTALIDAVHLSLDDFGTVPEKYGAHDFMVYVLTDGQENASRGKSTPQGGFGWIPRSTVSKELSARLDDLPQNVTVLGLAPDDTSAQLMCGYGFAKGNVALWDASTEAGLEKAVERIKEAHTSYVATRTATGVRGTKSAFVVGGNVDASTIKAAKLKPLGADDYAIVPVPKLSGLAFEKVVKKATKTKAEEKGWFVEIEPFVNKAHPPFRVGKAYYELAKTERLQGNKRIAVLETKSNKVYVGEGARKLLGLPEETRTVKPDFNPLYKIFVQSTSLNRHLPIGTSVLLLTK